MMRNSVKSALFVIGMTLALAATWSAGASLRGAPRSSITVARPVTQVHAMIVHALAATTSAEESHRRYRSAIPFGSPLFPPDSDLAAFAIPGSDPGLVQWLQLPSGERGSDLLIMPDVDYYWTVDHTEFSTEFIVHLRARGPHDTEIRVFQVHPVIRLGKKFDLLGRTGPGFYWDIRPAPPSPAASAALLDFLAAALSGPQQ